MTQRSTHNIHAIRELLQTGSTEAKVEEMAPYQPRKTEQEVKGENMATELTIERAELILPHLVACAKSRSTITYGELADRIGAHHRAVSRPLGYIRDQICIARGLPLITALVVNKASRMPGESWLPEGTGHLTPDEYQGEYEKLRDEAFACDAWDVLLEELGLPPIQEAAND